MRYLSQADGLQIDWAQMPMYNTIMALAAGAGLLLVVGLIRRLLNTDLEFRPDGWALAFGVLGAILTTTGLHMTLTWPLAAGPVWFDNIIFGEPALGFGVLLLAAAFYLWRRGDSLSSPVPLTVVGSGGIADPSAIGRGRPLAATASSPIGSTGPAGPSATLGFGTAVGFDTAVGAAPGTTELGTDVVSDTTASGSGTAIGVDRVTRLASVAGPMSVFIAALGLAAFGIAAAGIRYQLFAAPAEEPISGAFHNYPWVEAIFVSSLYALVGIGAVLAPLALRSPRGGLVRIIQAAWGVAGLAFLLFGAMNYFTHIGLIINTT